jgi:hypothetical protein
MTSCRVCEHYWWKSSRTGRHFRHYCKVKFVYMGNRAVETVWSLCPYFSPPVNLEEEYEDPLTKSILHDANNMEKRLRKYLGWES